MLNFYTKDWELKSIDTVLLDKDGTFQNDHLYWGKLAEKRVEAIIKKFNLSNNCFEDLCFAIGHNPKICRLIKNGPVGTLSRTDVIEFMVKYLKKYDIITDFKTMSDLFDDVHHEFMSQMEKYVDFIEYSEEFIKNLKSKGAKLAVVTSDSYSHTLEILKILKIDDCFECVIGKDSCEYEKKTGKPALLAIEKLQANPESTIVIGDAPMDAMMAENAKLRGSILVSTGQVDLEDLQKFSKYTVKNLSEVKIK